MLKVKLCRNIIADNMEKERKIPMVFYDRPHKFYGLPGALLIISILFTYGCSGTIPVKVKPVLLESKDMLPQMGYTIQAGAFSNVDNAARLTKRLQEKGLDAFYFIHDSGFFKVRFGNYESFNAASKAAEQLRSSGTIEEYYIVRPEDHPGFKDKKADKDSLRKGIVLSAKKYLGIPYLWGGESEKTGFDCSGLTMAVYKLNGFDLPRTSGKQWVKGNPVRLNQLSEGDLVFFSTKKKGVISHVGIYIGMGQFIHAPGEGKEIRMESLSTNYYKSRFIGARTYL
jgi:cell wall-associated NlpC family hydrolase